ncbi:MAG: TIM barrel protein [Oscillospiraceae bacterium]|nr:TIM barrel protein [Oscillospiraceae bacterium]
MGLKRSQIALGNYAHPLYSFDRFLDCAESLHINSLELWGAGPHFYFYDYTDERAKEFFKKIQDRGMKIICMTPEQCMYPINIACDDPVMRQRSIDYFKKGIDFCRIMDCPMLLVTPGKGYFDQPPEAAWSRCVEALREIGVYAAGAKVGLAVEHLTHLSTNVAVTAAQLASLVKEVALPNVGGMVDTDMAGRVEEGVADYLSAFGNRLSHVHLVDGMPGGHMVPGDGVLQLEKQMRQLAASGYQGYITPEIMHSSYQLEPEKALERTVRWMESVFAED